MEKNTYYERNKELVKAKARAIYEKNRKAILDRRRELYYEYSKGDKVGRAGKKSNYYIINKEALNEKQRKRHLLKYSTDPQFKIKGQMRSKINNLLKNNIWDIGLEAILGIDKTGFLNHVISKLQPGMSIQGRDKWHLDHIIPVKNFDLTKFEDLKRCYHYTNLCPMWARVNLNKAGQVKGKYPHLPEDYSNLNHIDKIW